MKGEKFVGRVRMQYELFFDVPADREGQRLPSTIVVSSHLHCCDSEAMATDIALAGA